MKIDWLNLRWQARTDPGLSDGGFRFLDGLIHHIHQARLGPDDEFPLPWSMVARWCYLAKDQAYFRIKELQRLGFITKTVRKGCPPINYFRFVPNWRVLPPIERRENPPIKVGINPPINCRGNPPDHISNPFRRRVPEKKKEDSTAPEGRHEAPERSRAAVKVDAERDSALLAALRAAVEFPEPPARGRSGRVAAK